MNRQRLIWTSLALPAFCGAAFGGGTLHDADVILGQEGGQVTTSRVVGGDMTALERVFIADVFDLAGVFIIVDDPGFDAPIGALPAFSVVEWTPLDALRVWDGDDFDALSGESIEFTFGSQSFFSSTSPQTSTGSIAMAVTQLGDMHHHPRQFLPMELEDGLYLMRFDIADSEVAEASDDFYFLYPWNVSPAEIQAAADYVRQTLVECPGDIDGDGVVGAADLANVIGVWGTSNLAEDLDQNGIIGAGDLAELLGRWGPCP